MEVGARMATGLAVTEKDIYEQCVSLLEQTGCAVYRLSQARASKQTPGLPDLIAFTPRHTMLLIETKRPGGRLRDAQRKFAERVLGTMGCPVYLVINDPRSLVEWIRHDP